MDSRFSFPANVVGSERSALFRFNIEIPKYQGDLVSPKDQYLGTLAKVIAQTNVFEQEKMSSIK